MYVEDVCPHCNGIAHPFENFQKIYLQIKSFNVLCYYNGKAIDEFYKMEDYYWRAIAFKLNQSEEAQ